MGKVEHILTLLHRPDLQTRAHWNKIKGLKCTGNLLFLTLTKKKSIIKLIFINWTILDQLKKAEAAKMFS